MRVNTRLSKFAWSLARVLTVLVLFSGAGCDNSPTLAGKWEYNEVSRTNSPNSLVDAVLVTGDAGATTSTSSMVYLLPKGAQFRVREEDDCIFAADHVKGLNIVWKKPQLLEIQYDEARILKFKNFWQTAEVQSFRHVVEIRLGPTTTDFSLPLRDRQW